MAVLRAARAEAEAAQAAAAAAASKAVQELAEVFRELEIQVSSMELLQELRRGEPTSSRKAVGAETRGGGRPRGSALQQDLVPRGDVQRDQGHRSGLGEEGMLGRDGRVSQTKGGLREGGRTGVRVTVGPVPSFTQEEERSLGVPLGVIDVEVEAVAEQLGRWCDLIDDALLNED